MTCITGNLWVVCGFSVGPRLTGASQSRHLKNRFYLKLVELEKKNREKWKDLNINSAHIYISHEYIRIFKPHKFYIPPSGVKVFFSYLCCCWHPMLVTEKDLRGPCHSWHKSGSGIQCREGCYWPYMCEWKGGQPSSSTLGCWSHVERPDNAAGHRALRRGREPTISPLFPELFAPTQLALVSWVHLATITIVMQKILLD